MRWCLLLCTCFLLVGGAAAEPPAIRRLGVRTTDGECSECYFTPEGSIMCGKKEYKGEHYAKVGSRKFWMSAAVSIGLVMGAATAAGLTMGLMSLDLMNLEILQKSGTPSEQHHAARIIPLVKQHHLLLVTLLLVNSCCNEALPLFLDELMHPVTNIIVSVTAVLLFGEIIPQAICTRHGLMIGSCAAPLVRMLIWAVWVVSFPIAKLLDCCLGQEAPMYYRRAQLKELVDIHGHPKGQCEDALSPDECTIIQGALDLRNKTVEDCLTPIEEVFMLRYNGVLDAETMKTIATGGHSRIPVFMEMKSPREDDRNQEYQIMGMILVRALIMVNPEQAVPVKSIAMQSVPIVPTSKPLYDMLNMFQEGRSHLAVVVDSRDHLTYRGVVTLEDVLEALIQEPIHDEKDRHRTMIVNCRQAAEGTQYGACAQSSGPGPMSMSMSMSVSMAMSQRSTATSFRDKPGGEGKGRLVVRQQREADAVPETITLSKSLSM